jgi:hypothetical protein
MVIVQKPNTLIILAAAAWLLARLTHGVLDAIGIAAFSMLITVWAYEEIVHGDSGFRRGLGLAVLVMTFTGMVYGILGN